MLCLQVFVIHVGTNNHGNTSEQIAGGIEAIAKLISEKHLQAYIVVTVSLKASFLFKYYSKKIYMFFSF